MQPTIRPAAEPRAPNRGLQFTIEPEPWLRVFGRNVGDLFRPAPPPVWVTAKPAEYWPDALVILSVYALNLAWLNQPKIVPEVTSRSPLRYQLSEYLPEVAPHNAKPEPP